MIAFKRGIRPFNLASMMAIVLSVAMLVVPLFGFSADGDQMQAQPAAVHPSPVVQAAPEPEAPLENPSEQGGAQQDSGAFEAGGTSAPGGPVNQGESGQENDPVPEASSGGGETSPGPAQAGATEAPAEAVDPTSGLNTDVGGMSPAPSAACSDAGDTAASASPIPNPSAVFASAGPSASASASDFCESSPTPSPTEFLLAKASSTLQPIEVYVSGVVSNGDGTCTATFGYNNPNSETVAGSDITRNEISSGTVIGGLITSFLPGNSASHGQYMRVVFSTNNTKWTLKIQKNHPVNAIAKRKILRRRHRHPRRP